MRITRVRALFAVLIGTVGAATIAFAPAAEAGVTASTITAPVSGKSFMITSDVVHATVSIKGTATGTPGDLLDIQCYFNVFSWQTVQDNVVLAANGSFTATLTDDDGYGTCRLRAVPDGLPAGSALGAFGGPLITSEWNTRQTITTGPNAGKVYDYYIAHQAGAAFNDFVSATRGGLWDSRLSYANGTSSNYLWYGNAGLLGNDGTNRSGIQVDGKNAFGPQSAKNLYQDNPGLPGLTVTVSRINGVTTIRERNPLVRCSVDNTFPPTPSSCPAFVSTGVRLDRTITTSDAGRQVLITDVWRSTDGAAHEISPHYEHWVDGHKDTSTGSQSTDVGIRYPGTTTFSTFTGVNTYGGSPAKPSTVLVRADNTAPDPSASLPRGAITFDYAYTSLRRVSNREFYIQRGFLALPAGGSVTTRQHFTMGGSQAEVNSKSATARVRLNPFRADALLRKAGTAAWVGNGVYNGTGAGQLLTTPTKRSRTATFLIKLQNDGTFSSGFRIRGQGSRNAYAVKYLKGAAGQVGITRAVVNGNYVVTLAPGGERIIRLVVTVKPGANLGAIASFLVRSTSVKDGASTDVVKARVKVVR